MNALARIAVPINVPVPSPLRLHLTLAAEARRRGDHAAAEAHECDALRELRRQIAEAKVEVAHGR